MSSVRAMQDEVEDRRLRWSCLMDGEADTAALRACLEEWSRGPDRARTDWALWHAAGDALRSSEVACWHSPNFDQRIAQALAAEPAILAPRRWSARTLRRMVLPGAAAAAATALLAVVAVPMLRAPAGPAIEVARVPQQMPAAEPTAVAKALPPPQIDSYIAAHREMTGNVGMPRTAPYLRTSTVLPER